METLLDIKNLSIAFGNDLNQQVRVVSDANIQLRYGEILGIVGESGCGKTTLARCILGLLPPSGKVVGGEIDFCGKDLLKLDKDSKREIRGKEVGMIFQDSMAALNPVRKIGVQFTETLTARMGINKVQAKAMAIELLTKVKLSNPTEIMGRYSFQLSGGMRQRVMIAMALALKPRLLIADEPTTALDVTVQAQILKEMYSLKEQFGTSIILVSHNLGVVYQVVDTIAVMYAGTVVEYGASSEIFNKPNHPYTKALIGSVPSLKESQEELISIAGTPPMLHSLPDGCVFHPRCRFASSICRLKKPNNIQTVTGVQVACHKVKQSAAKEGEGNIA
ncbi:ABC transporter ATP-binding protein [Proteinivorax tanatarense]|uniref:ABC transporter ATP-binding protein n=1 Tax=Proteinivorax tanatarense TaxID=1260629 RepID=A0AAU7VNL8_9FIRM